MLGQMELAHTVFPLGEYEKGEVRALATERALAAADRPESQDLCFVADGDYRRFLREWAPRALQPGPIVDRSGQVLGKHEGLALYTIGQRRGLGVSSPQPLYVLELDVEYNRVVVGTADELGRRELMAARVSYVVGRPPPEPVEVTVQIRYRAHEAPARWVPLGKGEARVIFDEPQRDVTPGQGVVAYRQEVLMGGGTIV
jgi:tRNA-specific 2-thiouridylase